MVVGWLLAAALLSPSSPSSENVNQPGAPADGVVVSAITVKDASDVLTGAGAKIQKIEYDHDGFSIAADLDQDRHVLFEGMTCKGVDKDSRCTEFKISSVWSIKTAKRANELAKKLGYNWTSVSADGTDLTLWRMDFTYGGITREHFRLIIGEFLQLRDEAESVIWPPKGGDGPR